MNISRQEAQELIKKSKNRIFNINFIKADKSIRNMNARKGVHNRLSGGQNSTSHKDNIITVFDMNLAKHRNFNIDKLVDIKVGGVRYTVKD